MKNRMTCHKTMGRLGAWLWFAGTLLSSSSAFGLDVVNIQGTDGQYTAGQTIEIMVQFDKDIEITPGPGSSWPYLQISLDPTDQQANCIPYGYFGPFMILEYTVQAGDFVDDLRYSSAIALRMNGATVYESGNPANYIDGLALLPFPGDPGSLSANNDIDIRTMNIMGKSSVAEGESVSWSVGRGGNRSTLLTVFLTYSPEGYVQGPSSVTIPEYSDAVSFSLNGVLPHPGVTITARPQGYPTNGLGDVSGMLEVTGVPRDLSFSGPQTIDEGQITEWTVSRSGSIQSAVTLSLLSGTPAVATVPNSITIEADQRQAAFNVEALDGDYSSLITATATGYTPASRAINVQNVDPVVNATVPASGTQGDVLTFVFTAADVAADRPVSGTWYFGDGATATVNSGQLVNHTYLETGAFTVTLVVADKDGGTVTQNFEVIITGGFVLSINLVDTGPSGIGTGTYTLTPAPNAYGFYRPDTTVLIEVFPDQPDVGGFNSYLYRWQGDGLPVEYTDLNPLAFPPPSTYSARMDQDRNYTIWLSREFLAGEGWGDLDADELPDLWELTYGLDSGSPNRMGNPDGDRLPGVSNQEMAYVWPLENGTYAPTGPLFGNVYEVRGLDGELYSADVPQFETEERNFWGTDPNDPDSDGDGMSDGWEYFFWMNAVVRGVTGEAYDPASITSGTLIDSATIAEDFHPLRSAPANLDTDGDGILNIEEYALGTNPIHWDTTGDGICDGWLLFRGLDPLVKLRPDHNPDGDYMADDGAGNLHFAVRNLHGFDPRTAWNRTYLNLRSGQTIGSPNTVPFTTYEEYKLMRFWIDQGYVTSVPATAEAWGEWSTDPLSADTDGDQMPDGWELYVATNPETGTIGFYPANGEDAGFDFDGDKLVNASEFASQQASAVYGFTNPNARWWNKPWPTDPWNWDTDGDGLSDYDEGDASFRYGEVMPAPVNGSYAGGMLNPTSVDTDGDFLPDFWEWQYVGINNGEGIERGMDGTVADAHEDYDADGLVNYQEYWVNLVAHFHYDKWPWFSQLDYPSSDPMLLIDGFPHEWDWNFYAEPMLGIPYYFKMPEVRDYYPPNAPGVRSRWGDGHPYLHWYAGTDPRVWDTDADGMDDYYEMYHGLNPLWSISRDMVGKPLVRPPLVRDARVQPWQVGDQSADPDQDGLPNFEEALHPNKAQPENYHTDPTPLWFTDMSYELSFVNMYYQTKSLPFYWGGLDGFMLPPSYIYSFESNEGYDTDNDNLPDKRELLGTDQPGSTDPLDPFSPPKRKALYLDGNAAVRTRQGFFHGEDALRSWTVELWLRPETVGGSRQIIIERPVQYEETDPMPATELVRRTFRLGIDEDGALFVEYDNAGNDLITRRARSSTGVLSAGEWQHVAGVMDGPNEQLRLYVNGQLMQTAQAAAIPATGVLDGYPSLFRVAPIVIGASDANPGGRVHGASIFYNGLTLAGPSQPLLAEYFQGWVDEVRVWDGVRGVNALNETMMKSLRAEDVELSVENRARFGSSEPLLLYHYNFANLPDPTYDPIVPDGFEALNGRPQDGSYPGIPWWWQAHDRSTVYDDYLFVHWIQNTAAHLPLDPPFDSKYWGLSSTGGEPATNRFPNSANPYGYGYTHGTDFMKEINPESFGAAISYGFDPRLDRMYNDLLPLRRAVADMDVELWDGYGPGTSVTYDSSGDGLPDEWKIQFGLNPYSAEGDDGAWGDPDGDELPNWAEYYAWVQFGVMLDPMNYDSDSDGLSDYNSRPSGSTPTFGQIYDDWDGMPGLWEIQYNLDPHSYDGQLDTDGDNWSNFAEFMAVSDPSQPADYPRPTMNFHLDYSGQKTPAAIIVHAYNRESMDGKPDATFLTQGDSVPVLNERLGSGTAGTTISASTDNIPVVPGSLTLNFVNAGVSAADDGQGNILYGGNGIGTIDYGTGAITIQLPAGGDVFADYRYGQQAFPYTYQTQTANVGYLREGRNWFFAFMDLNGNGTWEDGEPAAIAQYRPVQVSWGTVDVSLNLSDRAFGFPRFVWTPTVTEYSDVTITLGTTTVLLEKTLSGRNYVHEGDLLFMPEGTIYENNRYGLATSGSTPNYTWTVAHSNGETESGSFSFNWGEVSERVSPVLLSPNGATVPNALLECTWTMDARNAAVRIEMRSGSTTGPEVMNSKFALPRRRRGVDNQYYYTLYPQYQGRKYVELPDGDYYWRMVTDNPGLTFDAVTSWGMVRLDRTAGPAGPYRIEGRLEYFGQVDFPVTVQAFRRDNPHVGPDGLVREGFSGLPYAQVTVADPHQPFTLRGLPEGRYYLRAFLDQLGRGVPAAWETRGFLFDPGIDDPWPRHSLKGIDVGPNAFGYTIELRDQDTDNDRLADSWEVAQTGNLTDLGVQSATPLWQSTTMSLDGSTSGTVELSSEPLRSDANADGLPDLISQYLGTDPMAYDTDGDGFSDLMELFSGSDPTGGEGRPFMIPSLRLDPDGNPVVGWDIPAESLANTLIAGFVLVYEIEWRESLDASWQTLHTKIVHSIEDSGRMEWTHADPDGASGYYRIHAWVAELVQ